MSWQTITKKTENNQNDDILIASIDCTNAFGGKRLCVKFKVRGVPTILYGDASFGGVYLEEYPSTQKTFKDFQKFATIHLIPKCNPANLDACTADERKQIESYMTMRYQELDVKIKQVEKEEEDTKEFFKSEFDTLQSSYNTKLEEKTKYVSEVKDYARQYVHGSYYYQQRESESGNDSHRECLMGFGPSPSLLVCRK